jgi:hypothetical protein
MLFIVFSPHLRLTSDAELIIQVSGFRAQLLACQPVIRPDT